MTKQKKKPPILSEKGRIPGLEEYKRQLQSGAFVNLFYYFNKIDDGESDDYKIKCIRTYADVFLHHTSGQRRVSYDTFVAAEQQLLVALFAYLYFEAPLDEQNMFMIAVLLDAAKLSEDEVQSDTDRLFALLEKQGKNQAALNEYKNYQKRVGTTDCVLESCRLRFSPLFSDYNSSKLFDLVDTDNDMQKLATAIVCNLTNEGSALPHADLEDDFIVYEIRLLTQILLFARGRILTQNQTTGTFDLLFSMPLYYIMSNFAPNDKEAHAVFRSDNAQKALDSIKKRWRFWSEFDSSDENDLTIDNLKELFPANGVEGSRDEAQSHSDAGLKYWGEYDYKKAFIEFDRAAEIDPNSAVYIHNRGHCLYYLSDFTKALDDYDTAIRMDSDEKYPEWRTERSGVQIAIETGTSPELSHTRGLVYWKKQQYEQAIQEFERALELAPSNAIYLHSRGHCYYYLGEFEKALEDFNAAILLDSDEKYPEWRTQRAEIEEKLRASASEH